MCLYNNCATLSYLAIPFEDKKVFLFSNKIAEVMMIPSAVCSCKLCPPYLFQVHQMVLVKSQILNIENVNVDESTC